MNAKSYRLQVGLVCPECSKGNCSGHISKKMIVDKKSGLEFEVICECKKH